MELNGSDIGFDTFQMPPEFLPQFGEVRVKHFGGFRLGERSLGIDETRFPFGTRKPVEAHCEPGSLACESGAASTSSSALQN